MAIELKQQLKLSQQLVMTPQLQQAIKLLQLNRLELVTLVSQELQENPILEEVLESDEEMTRGEDTDQSPEETEAPVDVQAAQQEVAEPVVDADADASQDGPEVSDAEKIADIEWENYMDSHPQTGLEGRVGGDDEERRSLEATLTRQDSLQEHLEWQLHLSKLDEAETEIAGWIIGNIDDDGYLRSTVEEVARQAGVDEAAVEAALAKVQLFDPTGVGARDLRECLLLQLDALEIDEPRVRTIIDEHTDRLRKRDFRGIAREMGITIEEVAAAAQVIGHLEPWPGRAFGGDDPVYITPDIYVYKIGDEFHIVLNEDGLPKLRVSGLYRDVLSRGKDVQKDTRDYVQDKVRSAMWLIKSIHQRQRTIYRVMNSIVDYQREFFEQGVEHLKPLNLRDVADDIGMHESTVSRVTTGKYVHTPQGVFELKYFFNSSISRSDGGDDMSSETVKDKIRTIIGNEDRRRPLSDQRIAEMLKASNIDIARRTVSKYRESMNILSSTKRREIG